MPFFNPFGFAKKFTDVDVEWRWNHPELKFAGITKQNYGLGVNRLCVSDANLIKHILLTSPKDYTKPNERYSLFEDYGPNILTLNGEPWRKQRKLCDPSFSHSNLKMLTNVSYQCALKEMDKWKSGELMDIDEAMSSITLDIICSAGFGYNVEKIKQPKGMAPFRDVIKASVSPSVLIAKFIIPSFVYKCIESIPYFDNFAKRITRNTNDLEQYLTMIIEDRKNSKQENFDLLSLLLTSNDGDDVLTAREVISNSFIFLLAGHDTTSCQLSWTLYELSQNPDLQERILNEVKSICGEREPNIDDYAKLEFTNSVIKESLRLHPPIHAIMKYNVKDVKLDGYDIPARTMMLLNFYSVHRDERYWKEPLRFNPDRWVTDKTQICSYLPFSIGERKCIGLQFSLVESCIILTWIIRNFTIHAKNDLQEPQSTFGIVAKPQGLKLYFEKR